MDAVAGGGGGGVSQLRWCACCFREMPEAEMERHCFEYGGSKTSPARVVAWWVCRDRSQCLRERVSLSGSG